jgi:hypothetical protein
MLHVLLALNCIAGGRKHFEINKLVYVVALGVAFDKTAAMLLDAAHEVAGHADVDRAARSARKDVEIILAHGWSLPKRDGRDKPGHDR